MSEIVTVKKSEIERLSNAIHELGLALGENVKVRDQLNKVVLKLQSENKELKEENDRLNKFERNDILDLESS